MYAYSAVECEGESEGGVSLIPKGTQTRENSQARFWELCGCRVFEMSGVLWGHHKGGFYTCLPLQLRLDLEQDEIQSILRKASIRGLRIPSSNRPGFPGGMYMVRPAGYDLKSVNRKQRGHVAHGLEVCEIRPVEKEELLRQGMDLNRDTLTRQCREDDRFLDPSKWKHFVDAVSHCPGMAIHGAFVKGKLATYVISCREGDWLHLIYKMSSTAEREHYTNHALDYSIIRTAASDPSIKFIGNGGLSVLPNEGLDRYKRQMGYEIIEHNLCIHFHPRLASVLVNRITISMARLACSVFPGNETLAYGTQILEGAKISRSGSKSGTLASEAH